MTPQETIKLYLEQQHMMMLATVKADKPWSSTVYYVNDGAYNLYWASLPWRRHSQEIANHNQVAAAIPVNFSIGQPVAGIQLQGTVSIISIPEHIQPIAQRYAYKFGRDKQWVDDFSKGKTAHKLYKFAPSLFVLFDEVNFPEFGRQEFVHL